MKILLMGPQGSGKGTIGSMLSDSLGIPLISVGEVLRQLSSAHPRYQEIKGYMERGELVPQDFAAELLKERVSLPDCANGFIFDGWGRTLQDLELFDPGFDTVFNFVISPETSVYRLSNRRTCRNCGRVYNIVTVPPVTEGQCDVCGGELYQRSDDTEEAIKKRLEVYATETRQVLEKYRADGKLIEVDAEPAPEKVFQSTWEYIK
jgi:adenylate kinase